MPSLHRALILSATCPLGADVARLLKARGIAVQSMHAWNEPIPEDLQHPNVLWTTGAAHEEDTLKRACAGCDGVFLIPDMTQPLEVVLTSLRTTLHTLRAVTLSRTIVLLPAYTAAPDPDAPHTLHPTERVVPSKKQNDLTRKAYHIELEVLFHIAHSFPAVLLLYPLPISTSPHSSTSLTNLLRLLAQTPSLPTLRTGVCSVIDTRDIALFALTAYLHPQPNDRILLPAHTLATRDLMERVRTRSLLPPLPTALFWPAVRAVQSAATGHTTAHIHDLSTIADHLEHAQTTPYADRLGVSLRPLEDTLRDLNTLSHVS